MFLKSSFSSQSTDFCFSSVILLFAISISCLLYFMHFTFFLHYFSLFYVNSNFLAYAWNYLVISLPKQTNSSRELEADQSKQRQPIRSTWATLDLASGLGTGLLFKPHWTGNEWCNGISVNAQNSIKQNLADVFFPFSPTLFFPPLR